MPLSYSQSQMILYGSLSSVLYTLAGDAHLLSEVVGMSSNLYLRHYIGSLTHLYEYELKSKYSIMIQV